MGDFTIIQGNGRTFRVPVVDADGNPFDITDYTFVLAWATAPGEDADVEIDGSIIGDAEDGIVEFVVAPDDTGTVGSYYYEALGTKDTVPVTIDRGRINIIPGIIIGG